MMRSEPQTARALRIRYTLTTNPNIDHLYLKKHVCEVCPELLLS